MRTRLIELIEKMNNSEAMAFISYVKEKYSDVPLMDNTSIHQGMTKQQLITVFEKVTASLFTFQLAELYSEGLKYTEAMNNHPSIRLFLDVDGVLNSTGLSVTGIRIDDDLLAQVKCLVDEIEKKYNEKPVIVLSSSWRYSFRLQDKAGIYITEKFSRAGLKIHDCTGNDQEYRNEEIQNYLDLHPEIRSYVVLDDQPRFFSNNMDGRLILTSGSMGISEEDKARALESLNRQKNG